MDTRSLSGFIISVMLCFIPAFLVLPGLDILFWFLLKPEGFWQKFLFLIAAFACFTPQWFLACFVFYFMALVIEG
jgi:hypothetical protein